jgi:hypothetical protein
MIKKMVKVVLVLIMVCGIAFSILNFTSQKADGVMIDQLLDFYFVGDGYIYRCFSTGNGCHTVIPDN